MTFAEDIAAAIIALTGAQPSQQGGATQHFFYGKALSLAGVSFERWYPAGFPNGGSSSGSPGTATIHMLPFWSGYGGTIDAIAFNITVASGANGVAQIGIYDSDPVTLLPTTLIYDSKAAQGDFDATITGFKIASISPPFKMAPGTLYWFCYRCGTANPTISTIPNPTPIFGLNQSVNAQFGFQFTSQAYGLFANPFPTLTSNFTPSTANGPLIMARFI